MSDREVYPNAPVVLVALEVRHPAAGPLSHADQVKIKQLLGSQLPLLRTATMMNVQATIGAAPEVTTERAPRYVSRDRTTAVTFRSGAAVIETTRYERYERLRDLAALALESRQAVAPIDGVERLGLRYIDELRVPENGDETASWELWVDPTLLGPLLLGSRLGLSVSQWEGIAVFSNEPDTSLVLRYGPREGYAVDPAGDLKRAAPPPGPFFLVDIDSFWTPTDDVPEFDVQKLLAVLDDLHNPVRTLFEGLITERLRKEVLRHGG
jgi:uncharacterized protein (TIGR04255 family)